MKIKISSFCSVCQKDAGSKQVESPEGIVEFNDENLYELTCKKGHKCYTRLQETKFELLFDQGAMALIDGYSKESVSSIASSLERFIEFFLKLIAVHNEVSLENYSKGWKKMSKQSERQLGAFYFAQISEWKEILFTLDENQTNFRNKVTHQGYIPTKVEAINYGNYVLQFIYSVLKKLKETHPKIVDKGGIYHLLNSGELIPKNASGTNTSIPTIISLRSINSKDFGLINFDDAIKELAKNSFYKAFYRRVM